MSKYIGGGKRYFIKIRTFRLYCSYSRFTLPCYKNNIDINLLVSCVNRYNKLQTWVQIRAQKLITVWFLCYKVDCDSVCLFPHISVSFVYMRLKLCRWVRGTRGMVCTLNTLKNLTFDVDYLTQNNRSS